MKNRVRPLVKLVEAAMDQLYSDGLDDPCGVVIGLARGLECPMGDCAMWSADL
jgi:hypothetical protein